MTAPPDRRGDDARTTFGRCVQHVMGSIADLLENACAKLGHELVEVEG